MTFSREANAFLLSFLASLGTFVGGILVCLLTLVFSKTSKQSERSLIGFLQALSAGVMLYMSLLDLVPECIEKLGSFKALVLFFLGVFGFLVLDYLIPEAAHEHAHQDHVETEENTVQDSPTKAGLRKRNTKSPSSSPSPSKNKIKRSSSDAELQRTGYVTFIIFNLDLLLYFFTISRKVSVYI